MGCRHSTQSTSNATQDQVELHSVALPTTEQGVSVDGVSFFITALQSVEDYSPTMTTSDACVKYVKPLTLEAGTSYLQTLDSTFVGPATVFVSHAWRYAIMDVLNTMLKYAESHPNTYFWFDLFVNDQNNAPNYPYSWWATTFQSQVGQIGRTMLVMSPWNDPIPLTRAWCLFEIRATLETGSQLEIVLPEQQKQMLKEALLKDPKTVLQVLADVDGEKADAFKASDREQIFKAVQEMDGGFRKLNGDVKVLMRGWMMDVGRSLEKEEKEACGDGEEERKALALLCNQVGFVMDDLGELDQALEYFHKALAIYEEVLGLKHPSTATTYFNIGALYKGMNDIPNARKYLEKTLAVYNEVLGSQHPDTKNAQAWLDGLV